MTFFINKMAFAVGIPIFLKFYIAVIAKIQLYIMPIPYLIQIGTPFNKYLSIDGIPNLENSHPEFDVFILFF